MGTTISVKVTKVTAKPGKDELSDPVIEIALQTEGAGEIARIGRYIGKWVRATFESDLEQEPLPFDDIEVEPIVLSMAR